jgi:cytochrome c oxidase subunit II
VRSMGKLFSAVLAVIALASVGLFLSRHWMPSPAAKHAPILDSQLHWTLTDAGVIFLTAQFILAVFVWKFRTRPDRKTKTFPAGVQIAVVIAVVFIGIELFSAATLGRHAWASMYDGSSSDSIQIEVMGQQFAYYFRYPGADGKFGPVHTDKIDASIGNYFGLDRANDIDSKDDVMSAELVLPENRPIDLLLTAQDVIHSFYVRELRVQQDMVPGMRIPVHFTPTKVGRYEVVCTQLCGLGHYRMRAFVRVVPETEFESWMRAHTR